MIDIAKEPLIERAFLSCHVEPRADCEGRQGEQLPHFTLSYRNRIGTCIGPDPDVYEKKTIEIFLTKAQILEMKL